MGTGDEMDGIAETHEVLLMTLPRHWLVLPTDFIEALAWWETVGDLVARRTAGQIQPISTLRDVDVRVVRSADDVRAIGVKHPCASCLAGTEAAIRAFDEGLTVAVLVQFGFDDLGVQRR